MACVAFIAFATAAGTLEAISLNVGENLRSRPAANAALMLPKSSNFNCNRGLPSIRLQLAENGPAKCGKVLDNLCAEYRINSKQNLEQSIDLKVNEKSGTVKVSSLFMTGKCCQAKAVAAQQQQETNALSALCQICNCCKACLAGQELHYHGPTGQRNVADTFVGFRIRHAHDFLSSRHQIMSS